MAIYEDAIFIINCFNNYVDNIIETSRKDYLRKYYKTKNREIITAFENDETITTLAIHKDNYFLDQKLNYWEIEKLFADEILYNKTKALSPKHKQVLYYLFVEELTPSETATIMKLSNGRITQLKNEAFDSLRG